MQDEYSVRLKPTNNDPRHDVDVHLPVHSFVHLAVLVRVNDGLSLDLILVLVRGELIHGGNGVDGG